MTETERTEEPDQNRTEKDQSPAEEAKTEESKQLEEGSETPG
jgi:hypothetical protein